MRSSFNFAQAKLLASFCSDISKGLLLAAISAPFVGSAWWMFKFLISFVIFIIAAKFLSLAVELLRGFEE